MQDFSVNTMSYTCTVYASYVKMAEEYLLCVCVCVCVCVCACDSQVWSHSSVVDPHNVQREENNDTRGQVLVSSQHLYVPTLYMYMGGREYYM